MEAEMSDAANPYQAPSTGIEGAQQDVSGNGVVTGKTIEYLGKAAPWSKFLGVMGYIFAGFAMLGGVSFLGMAPMMAALGGLSGTSMAGFGAVGPLVGLLYIGIGVAYLFPSRYAYRLGTTMQQLKADASAALVEKLAKDLSGIIRFLGWFLIIGFAIGIVAIIVVMAVSINVAMNAYR